MADKNNKVPENVDGSFYVDTECTGCEACVDVAENNFKMNEDGSNAYVFKQPENDDERSECEDAMDSCPSEAIGNDG